LLWLLWLLASFAPIIDAKNAMEWWIKWRHTPCAVETKQNYTQSKTLLLDFDAFIGSSEPKQKKIRSDPKPPNAATIAVHHYGCGASIRKEGTFNAIGSSTILVQLKGWEKGKFVLSVSPQWSRPPTATAAFGIHCCKKQLRGFGSNFYCFGSEDPIKTSKSSRSVFYWV
jgi:hypothetical protein